MPTYNGFVALGTIGRQWKNRLSLDQNYCRATIDDPLGEEKLSNVQDMFKSDEQVQTKKF